MKLLLAIFISFSVSTAMAAGECRIRYNEDNYKFQWAKDGVVFGENSKDFKTIFSIKEKLITDQTCQSIAKSPCDISYDEKHFKYQVTMNGKIFGPQYGELKEALEFDKKLVSEEICRPLVPAYCDIDYDYLFYKYQMIRGDREFGDRFNEYKDVNKLIKHYIELNLCKERGPETDIIDALTLGNKDTEKIKKAAEIPVNDSSKNKDRIISIPLDPAFNSNTLSK